MVQKNLSRRFSGDRGRLRVEYGELLPKGENFQGRIPSTAEEDADHGEDGEHEFRHGFTVVTWRNARWARRQQRNADC
jgi:hypothetical protein